MNRKHQPWYILCLMAIASFPGKIFAIAPNIEMIQTAYGPPPEQTLFNVVLRLGYIIVLPAIFIIGLVIISLKFFKKSKKK